MMNDSGIFIVKHEILQHAFNLPIPCPTPHLKFSYKLNSQGLVYESGRYIRSNIGL